MARDWLMASIDAREDAAANASEAMAAVVEKLDRTRTSCNREFALVEILDEHIESGARDIRRSAAESIEGYERGGARVPRQPRAAHDRGRGLDRRRLGAP